jgi:hypothetical protein
MERQVHYATVSQAIEQLRLQGFTHDFNIEDDCIICAADKIHADDFEIVDIYRYEGDTDPGDEATVYAIASKAGLKGILVTGYGMSADAFSTAILDKLRRSNT